MQPNRPAGVRGIAQQTAAPFQHRQTRPCPEGMGCGQPTQLLQALMHAFTHWPRSTSLSPRSRKIPNSPNGHRAMADPLLGHGAEQTPRASGLAGHLTLKLEFRRANRNHITTSAGHTKMRNGQVDFVLHACSRNDVTGSPPGVTAVPGLVLGSL